MSSPSRKQAGFAFALFTATILIGTREETTAFVKSLFAPRVSAEEAFRRAKDARAAKDPAAQFYWMKFAAEHNHPQAEDDLGYLYSKGIGVAADDTEAFGWFVKAAQNGNALGEFNLGVMYENGRGIDRRDLNAAQVWYQAAAENGYEPAAKALKEIAGLKAKEAAEQRQQADTLKTIIIGAGALWLASKLLGGAGQYANHGSGNSSGGTTYGWSTSPTDMSLPERSRPDTSAGCAWGDRAYDTCH